MKKPNRFALAVLVSLTVAPLLAQDLDLGTIGEEEPSPDDEKPYDPTLPYSSANDPGTDQAPVWDDVLFEPAPVDPALVSLFDLPEGAEALEPKDTPFPAVAGCGTFSGTVAPLQLWNRNPRYFSFAGRPKILVGVSADNSCALLKPPPPPPDQQPPDGIPIRVDERCAHNPNLRTDCRADTYDQILTDAAARGLNRTRLWVVLPSEPDTDNHIFAWDTARGLYRLDIVNGNYLGRLRAVVDRAKQLNMFVEVTFFAPGTSIGKPPDFMKGPWGGKGGYSTPRGQTGTGVTLTTVKFPAQGDFARATASEATEDPVRKRMQEFQKNVVDWVVEALWCYDNVWWEIANEPDGLIGKTLDAAGQSTGHPTGTEIADWQKRVIGWVRAAEALHAAQLPVGHPIAVNPLTRAGADLLINHPQVSVLEGHYTTVAAFTPIASVNLDLGVNQLLRDRRTLTNRLFGLNEDKITPLANLAKNTVHETHRNTVIPSQVEWGAVEPQRAGAWEAMFHQAGTVDLFGYCYSSPQGKAIRDQLGRLKTFMASLPLAFLRPAPLVGSAPPRWLPPLAPPLPGLGVYPIDHANWESTTGSSKYWAALETADTATGRAFAAYFHHSAPRCKGANQDFLPPNETACNRNQLTFQGYDARIKAGGHRERLRLSLGVAPGTFLVEWIDPATLVLRDSLLVTWNPAGSGTCTGSVQAGTCVVESPAYDFDVVLKVIQQ